MILISIGVVGKEITYFRELNTLAQHEFIDDNHSNYVHAVEAIIAWNVFLLLFLPFYAYATYNFSPKIFKWILALFFVVLWLPKIIVSIAFLEGDNQLKDEKYKLYQSFDGNFEFCDKNLIQCATSKSYVNAVRAETAFVIIFFIFSIPLSICFYRINENNPESQQKSQEQNKNQEQKPYQDNEKGQQNNGNRQKYIDKDDDLQNNED